MDYFQLQFEGAVMNVINPWQLTILRQVYSEGSVGYRDALCVGLTHEVVNVNVSQGRSLGITLDNDWTLEVALGEKDYRYGPEGVVLWVDDEWNVW